MRVFLLSCLLMSVQAADVYSWRDADGVRHFGEKPPENAVDVKKHNVKNEPAPTSNPDRDHINDSQRLLRAFDEERAEKNQQKAQRKIEQLQRQHDCERLKSEFDDYNNSNNHFIKEANGKVRPATAAEDREYERQMRDAMAELCN